MCCLTLCLSTFSRYSSVTVFSFSFSFSFNDLLFPRFGIFSIQGHAVYLFHSGLLTCSPVTYILILIYFLFSSFFSSLSSLVSFSSHSSSSLCKSCLGLFLVWGSPLEASGPLGDSIKMPKQIRWWSMLCPGEWEGHQGDNFFSCQ